MWRNSCGNATFLNCPYLLNLNQFVRFLAHFSAVLLLHTKCWYIIRIDGYFRIRIFESCFLNESQRCYAWHVKRQPGSGLVKNNDTKCRSNFCTTAGFLVWCCDEMTVHERHNAKKTLKQYSSIWRWTLSTFPKSLTPCWPLKCREGSCI